MEHVSSHRPQEERSERQGALRWSLFLLIAVVVVAAVIAGAIHGRFASAVSGVQPRFFQWSISPASSYGGQRFWSMFSASSSCLISRS